RGPSAITRRPAGRGRARRRGGGERQGAAARELVAGAGAVAHREADRTLVRRLLLALPPRASLDHAADPLSLLALAHLARLPPWVQDPSRRSRAGAGRGGHVRRGRRLPARADRPRRQGRTDDTMRFGGGGLLARAVGLHPSAARGAAPELPGVGGGGITPRLERFRGSGSRQTSGQLSGSLATSATSLHKPHSAQSPCFLRKPIRMPLNSAGRSMCRKWPTPSISRYSSFGIIFRTADLYSSSQNGAFAMIASTGTSMGSSFQSAGLNMFRM